MNEKITAPARRGYIDVIRVFATCAVIVLHCIYVYFNAKSNFGKPLWYILGYINELSRTGVPLFFMISGYLMLSRDHENIGAFYKKRFLKIGIPFLLYDVFYYFVGAANSGKTPTLRHFMKELLNNGSEYHLWFVYSILFIYLLVPFLRKMVKACSEKQLWILFAIAVFQTTIRPFVNLFLRGVGVSVYFTADGFSGYIGYVLLGYILGTYCERRLTCGVIYTAGALFFIITPIVSMHSAVNGGEMYLSGGYSVNHYVEAAAIFLLCKNTVKSTSRVFSALSSVSFSAYLIHVFIIEGMRQVEFYVVPWVLLTIYVCVSVPLSFLWGGLVKLAASLASKTRQMIKNNKPERRKNDNG